MRILSVDPGYDRLGVAVLEKEKQGAKEVLLFSDCLQSNKEDTYAYRLRDIGEQFEKVIVEFSPDAFATEALFFTTNQKTAINVAGARGMLFYIATKYNLPLYEYTPLQIKIATTGYGRSDKKQVIAMVQRLVEIKKEKALDDEYDAIATGITYFATERL